MLQCIDVRGGATYVTGGKCMQVRKLVMMMSLTYSSSDLVTLLPFTVTGVSVFVDIFKQPNGICGCGIGEVFWYALVKSIHLPLLNTFVG